MAGLPVLIGKEDIARLLHFKDLLPRLEAALAQFSKHDISEVIQPVRTVVPLTKHNGYDPSDSLKSTMKVRNLILLGHSLFLLFR